MTQRVAVKSPLQQHGTGMTLLFKAVIALLIIVSAYLVFEFGRIKAGYDIVDASGERQAYEDRAMQLEDEIIELKQEVALLETHLNVDRVSYKEVEASLVTLQSKIQEQQDAIAFYRGIVSPADGKAGLRVQDLRLTRGSSERRFSVRLVLVQAMKHDQKVSGSVALSVEGDEDGVEKTYSYDELLADNSDKEWKYSFRYFQDFDRELVLPDGFTPERINVEVTSRTRSISSIEESFLWATSQS